MKRKRKTTKAARARRVSSDPLRLPFIEHLLELRRRLFFVAVSVLLWSAAAYAVEHAIVGLLLAPAGGQKFVYTSPGGGIDFLFRVCLYVGLVLSIPVIIYQILRYVQPLIGKHSTRFIVLGSLASGVLAIAGVMFGYFLGLPAALEFLLNQFHTEDITAMITIQSYLSFVILYLAGSSLMFQVPLVIYFINRIKPLRVKSLLRYERWVILISFIVAAMINPSPRIYDMTMLAIPMIMSYQIGVGIVWWTKRKNRRSPAIQRLFEQDRALRREREERLKTVQYVWEQSELAASLAPPPTPTPLSADTFGKKAVATHSAATPKAAATSVPALPKGSKEHSTSHPTRPKTSPGRSQKYVNDFIITGRPNRGSRIASI